MILSIETSTMLGGLALLDPSEGLIAERRLNIKATHSERLMPELEAMLSLAGISVRELDAVAVSIGPGTFTGLRVGLSAAKGLAMSAGLKLVPVPTLEAMAFCMPYSNSPICPMLDARKIEVYTALYDTSEGIARELILASVSKASDFADSLVKFEKVVFMGQGALIYQKDITRVLGPKAVLAPPHLMLPSPASVAALGLRILGKGALPAPEALTPLYIRKSEAELKKPG